MVADSSSSGDDVSDSVGPEAGFEVERLRRWGGEDLVREVLGLFLRETPERLMRMGTALAQSDLQETRNVAHSLKSSAGNIGATRVAELCRQLEAAAEDGRLEQARRLLKDIEGRFDEIRPELVRLTGSRTEEGS